MYSRHGLRSPIGAKELDRSSKIFSDIVAFSDATRDTKELSRLLNVSEQIITSHAEELIKKGILQQF
jgi:Mn-dependent DtxR family transcriptional regulator